MNKITFTTLCLISPSLAFAYVDPGTGALLVQGLLGVVAALSLFWRRVKNAIRSLFGRKPVAVEHGIDDEVLDTVDKNDE